MSRSRVLVVLAAVIAVGVAGGLVGALGHRTPDPVADQNVVVDGQPYNCGTSGRVRLEVSVGYVGAGAYFTLDDERQPYVVEPRGGLRMAATPPYSCADGETHTVHIESRYPNPMAAGCSIRLLPDVQNRVGYNSADFDGWNNGSVTCDATWTD